VTEGLHDFTTRLLLRYFRLGRSAQGSTPIVHRIEDIDILRWHWSTSSAVLNLCDHVLRNRHELQSSLAERRRTDDAMVRGRIDARRTVLTRAVSGHPTRVVFAEPVRSYTSGPNHVLVWVLQRAHFLLARFTAEAGPSSSYSEKIATAMKALSGARRISTVAQAIADTDYTQYPSPQSLAQAAAARKRLYRLAHAALQLLRRVEDGDSGAIAGMLEETLIAPLHEWQAFELALALGMGAALADTTGGALQLRRIAPGSASAIIEASGYTLHWQSRTPAYSAPSPEPSEERVNAILMAYGVQAGEDRPDVVVSHSATGEVVAIGEAKFFTDETDGWRSAFRDAAVQLVRYARGYASDGALNHLLECSVIGLWNYPTSARPPLPPIHAPAVADFADLRDGELTGWAARVLAPVPITHSAA
jgi:hypothetical protein